MGKGTDNKIRKNLIISCLVELIAEQLRGKNVETQKDSVKSQLEEHLSAKLVVKIIQDLHERLGQKAKAEFAVNLLADVQLLRNGKIPAASSRAESILPGAIAAISQLIPGAAQAESSPAPTSATATSSSSPAASSAPAKAKAKPADKVKTPAQTKTEPVTSTEQPTQHQPKAQQPQQAEQPQAQVQPSPTNQTTLSAAVSKSAEDKALPVKEADASGKDKKRPLKEKSGEDPSVVAGKASTDDVDGSESAQKKQKLEVNL